jgi:hypothetical protein
MSQVRAGAKSTKQLLRKVRPGYQLRASGSSKFHLVDRDGQLVRRRCGQPSQSLTRPRTLGRSARQRQN